MKQVNILPFFFILFFVMSSNTTVPGTTQNTTKEDSNAINAVNSIFIPPVRINDYALGAQTDPEIAVSNDGIVFAVWQDQRNFATRKTDIYFSKSIDGGFTWNNSSGINDDNTNTEQHDPTITIDRSGTIYVAWVDRRNNLLDIYFSKSTDGGKTWTPNNRVTQINPGAYNPKIAVDDKVTGNIYIVWEDYRSMTNFDIYFTRSTDGGLTWEPDIKVNDDNLPDNDQMNPSIGVDKHGTIYLAWNDRRGHPYYVYYAVSTNFGVSFSPNKPIGPPYFTFISGSSSDITVSENSAFFLVNGENNSRGGMYLLKTSNFGNSFEEPSFIFPWHWGDISIDSQIGVLHFLTSDYSSLLYSFSTNLGKSWKNMTKICSINNITGFPKLATHNGVAYVVFEVYNQTSNDRDIYFTRSELPPFVNYSRQLHRGWNLISIPVINDTSMSTILKSIDGKYDTAQWYDANDFNDHWKMYSPSKPSYMNDLTKITPSMGLWVHVTEDCVLNVSGYRPFRSVIELYEGWNLVGHPARNNTTVQNLLTTVPAIKRVQGFDATAQYLIRDLRPTEELSAGNGYWVFCSKQTWWYVDWE